MVVQMWACKNVVYSTLGGTMTTKRVAPTVAPGQITRAFEKAEVAELVALWLAAFGANRHGVSARAYMWHVFSFERYPSVSGVVAHSEYEKHVAPEYIVLSNERDVALETDVRPVLCSLSDYLVFPRNLAWTMAFTHEDGWLGPYFARHKMFSTLNAANLAQVQKRREAEQAKLKKWR